MGASYSGIGSREVKDLPATGQEMFEIAHDLAILGYILRSGGADGADIAFEAGCDSGHGAKEIFLPWKGFNGNNSPFHRPSTEALETARDLLGPYHWGNLKEGGRLMHGRNCHQVLGAHLDNPADFVLCWTPGGKDVGGTATAIKLARRHGIPVINMALEGWRQDLDELVNETQQR